MKKESKRTIAPPFFYRQGDLHPIKLTLLCEYPIKEPNFYGVYLNSQTKLPERVYLPSITDRQLNFDLVFQDVYKSAVWRVESVKESMKGYGIEIKK